MLTPERQKLIENYVNQHELCRVSDLCTIAATSESTIRRDLIQMEKKGQLKRIHGGAQSVKNFTHDVSQHIRFTMNHDEKIRIARYAVQQYVHEDDYIFIDAGTTAYEMVPFLATMQGVTVVTNGLETALGALNHGINTMLLGGQIKEDTHAVVGQFALEQLQGMNFAASFVGANGIDYQGDLTTPDPEEAAIKKLEIARSNHTYVLTDASKLGERNFAVFGNVSQVTVITTALAARQKDLLPAEADLKEVID
ncbi:DeoR/GlpR family DNA-binding transcription regulator [Lactobacillus xylocopicola]|uniref:DeoR family transcriptional regulator n=1 Tax=Lactobacillus xylocopicola TaxID=2976676 RepID=A0ABM8BIY6_9LACO|nr:DeoR/GlpR family DNA-binding transcription regulator [Lactobacillus xylocopicola]BDR61075.1 DeoR family transcriptional regulator [Lactobacillus xylocopicola]